MENSIYLFLSSNSSDLYDEFSTQLYRQITLEGDWECALVDITFSVPVMSKHDPMQQSQTANLYVCSDIVEPVCVRETAYQVLRQISTSINTFNDVHIAFATRYYLPLATHRLGKVTISVKDLNLQRPLYTPHRRGRVTAVKTGALPKRLVNTGHIPRKLACICTGHVSKNFPHLSNKRGIK